jgi:RHS repeat-associated protein
MWDAVSGGNQIQSIALQQSGGAPTNRIATVSGVSYSYDAAGNVVSDGAHSYSYDAENRVVSVDGGGTAQYGYDHRNWRVKKIAGAAIHYIWERGQVIAEHDASTGAVQVDYVYAGGRMIAKVSGGSRQYFISDRLSVRMTLDSSGNVTGRQGHLPYGEDFAETGAQEKHHFTSYERDAESGLDYAVNRYDARSIGRFNQVDPIRGNTANPQSLNRYAYVANDPINSTDPQGLCPAGTTPGPDGECVVTLSVTESLPNPDVIDFSQDIGLLIDGGFGLISGTGTGIDTTEPEQPQPGKKPCNPEFFEPGFSITRNGRTFTAADLNYAARVIYAEAAPASLGGNGEEKKAIASVLYNRISDGLPTFKAVANSGGFLSVTGENTKAFKRTDTENGKYQKLSEADCDALRESVSAIADLIVFGSAYTQFGAFRGGTTPLREGLTVIGGSRFAASDDVFNRRSRKRR